MKKVIEISDELAITIVIKKTRTMISICHNDKKTILVDNETDEYFWDGVVFNKDYIVIYSRGCQVNQIPLKIETAYDIKEKRVLNLSNPKIKKAFEDMLIYKRMFELKDILKFINNNNLEEKEENNDLKTILTCGNNEISDDEVINYILRQYPILSNYRNLNFPLTDIEYEKILGQLGRGTFPLHSMPQNLKFLEQPNFENTNENEIQEYDCKLRLLRKK